VDSVEAGSADTITVANTPDTFAYTGGNTVIITDGILTGDIFEILDYALVTAHATNHGYIWAKAGSETLIRYADIEQIGKAVANKYGINFDGVDGSNANEGVIIDKSRIHDGYYGIDFNGSSNNNTANSAGVLSSNIYNNSSYGVVLDSSDNISITSNNSFTNSYGFYLTSSNNNILTSNNSYGNTSQGFKVSTNSNNNTLTSNIIYSHSTGINIGNSSDNIFSSNDVYSNSTEGFSLITAPNNTFFFNNIFSSNKGYKINGSSGNIIINEDYGVNGVNTDADIYFLDASSASTLRAYSIDLASSTEVDNLTYAGAYLISYKHDKTAGAAKVWGEYTVPDDNAKTPQDEGTNKFNYAEGLYVKGTTPHGYSGTGTEDTDIAPNISSWGGGSPIWYRAEVTTANGDTPIFTITSSSGSPSPATYTLPGTYTDSNTNIAFTIADGGTDYVVGDTYTFVAYPASGDTNTTKTLTVQQDLDTITVGTGETIEMIGQSGNLTAVTGATGTYAITITGTINANYYSMENMGGSWVEYAIWGNCYGLK